ncbi:MAG: L-rhamnose mutarotase [Pseudomonadota bacterium]
MKRIGMVIRVRPEKLAEYKKLHANPWPQVLEILRQHHVKNYVIYQHDDLLFGHLEYHGDDYQADMKKVAAHPVTQEWWTFTDPCQEPLASRKPGEWWAEMDEVFFMA